MSADNQITILSTMSKSGWRVYRVMEHGESGTPLVSYREPVTGRLKTRCRDAACLVNIFQDAPVYYSLLEAETEAERQEEASFIEYGISQADLDETWEALLEQADALNKRRKNCHHFKESKEPEEDNNSDDDFDACTCLEHIFKVLLQRGWLREEVTAAHDFLQEIRKDGNHYYFDRLRLARMHKGNEMAMFERLKGKGCCRSYEKVLKVAISGRPTSRVMIGFNYEH